MVATSSNTSKSRDGRHCTSPGKRRRTPPPSPFYSSALLSTEVKTGREGGREGRRRYKSFWHAYQTIVSS